MLLTELGGSQPTHIAISFDRGPQQTLDALEKGIRMSRCISVLSIVAVLSGTALCRAQVTLFTLPNVSDQSQARAVSADGSTIVGSLGCQTFVWRLGESVTLFGQSGCTNPDDVSADGSMVVGTTSQFGVPGQQGYKWTASGGMQLLGIEGQAPFSHAKRLSDDGLVVVGSFTDGVNPYASATWRNGGPWQAAPVSHDWLAVNADGSVLAGVYQVSFTPPVAVPFRQRDDGIEYMENLLGAVNANPADCSADGSVVVGGTAILASPILSRATLWNEAGDAMDLGCLPNHYGSGAYAVSGDGTTVVGISYNSSTTDHRGFIWSESRGMRSLNDVASVATSDRIWQASSVSFDGCIVVGGIMVNGVSRAFALRSIPVPSARATSVSACPSGVTNLHVDLDPSGFGTVQYQWERVNSEGLVSTLVDGPLPDSVSTLTGTQTGQLSISLADSITVASQYRCRVWNACGSAISEPITLVLLGVAPAPCDNLDFNNDCSVYDPLDINDFLSVYGEGECSTGNCNDIDFNNDTSVFDPIDIDAFLSVFGEGPCI